jgi:iron complex outermembrane receptor protein
MISIESKAQRDSIPIISIDSVTINASRSTEPQLILPLASTKLSLIETQDIRQQLSLQDYLQEVPGLFSLNANNFSQDLRVSIRGFGSRSAFGIRGIKILVDGIPETTPDGQGQIDNLNLAVIKDIEVIRGPSSALYGNASGGVISIQTIDHVKDDFIKGAMTLGSYGSQKFQLLSGFQGRKSTYVFQGSHTKTDGYRDQSGFKNNNINGKMKFHISEKSKLNININYTDSPKAEDAGGLTLDELNTNRRQARQRNVDFKTEEFVSQFKIGGNFNHEFSEKMTLETYGFYSYRDFYGRLPFEFGGIVDLNRNYFGNGSSINVKSTNNQLKLGYDWAIQNDQRSRFRNLEGEQGAKTLGQLEKFSTIGFYALNHYTIDAFLIRMGIRYDANTLKAEDDFLENGDDSGSINLNAFNPSLGVSYKLSSKKTIFTGFSTSFETPALSELSANPSDIGGFNEALKPQKAQNYEVGYRSVNSKHRFEAVLFYIHTKDDLVPYELEEFPDRTFYRNAGSTNRKGLELSYQRNLTNQLKLSTVYTYSDFEYDTYSIPSGDFKGNALPAIPKHKALVSLLYQNERLTVKLEANHIGGLFTNDANSAEVEGYTLANLNFGYKAKLGRLKLSPFLGFNNIFDTTYNDNIRINAFGGRFYEAAPGFNVFGGLRVQL